MTKENSSKAQSLKKYYDFTLSFSGGKLQAVLGE